MISSLETERLLLRRFTTRDVEGLLELHADPEVNRFLPWHPLETLEDAYDFYERTYETDDGGYRYAICLKENDRVIGYVHVKGDESRDMGYGLRREFWNRGIVTEACRAVIGQLERDGVPYITATHDIDNAASGRVMQKLGMSYRYTYRELWQPKGLPVTFRMYQLNLDGNSGRTYEGYRQRYPENVVEVCIGNIQESGPYGSNCPIVDTKTWTICGS
ncbi:MAG TPA: GNAT family N-acetyltransferase [Sphaerochaeta sp.]|jgi:ribosomal-protein-alanine N-acetyltransferase|nr:GNAT family N-acetyltransferase [Sphaerochaeta sp.]